MPHTVAADTMIEKRDMVPPCPYGSRQQEYEIVQREPGRLQEKGKKRGIF